MIKLELNLWTHHFWHYSKVKSWSRSQEWCSDSKLRHKFRVCVALEAWVHAFKVYTGIFDTRLQQTYVYTVVCFFFFLTFWQFYFTRQQGSQSLADIFLISLSVLVCACVWFMWLSRPSEHDAGLSILCCLMLQDMRSHWPPYLNYKTTSNHTGWKIGTKWLPRKGEELGQHWRVDSSRFGENKRGKAALWDCGPAGALSMVRMTIRTCRYLENIILV